MQWSPLKKAEATQMWLLIAWLSVMRLATAHDAHGYSTLSRVDVSVQGLMAVEVRECSRACCHVAMT